jgi:hypothetical protein
MRVYLPIINAEHLKEIKLYIFTSVDYLALPGTISQYNCEIVPCRLI